MSLPRIFVHIPSYRDRECQWTVRDLFEQASHPGRVFVGICWQTEPEEDADCFLVETRPEQVRSVHFHIREARGLGWARQHARSLWQDEEYSLQIDSHMRFVPGWDERMLALLAACDSPDPVLTGYPPGYTPPDHRHERQRPHVQCIKRFLPSGILEFTCLPVPDGVGGERPLPTAACAGGFIFGSSRILRDVPFDAEIYFNGEEPSLAVRLWTHGFDLYSPRETVIYHYYRREDGSRHWNDYKDAHALQKRTLRRLKALCEPAACPLEEVAELGVYGLGSRRSLAEYEAFSGVNFAGRTIAAYARRYPFVRSGAETTALSPDAGLAPAPGLHLFILDDEGLLFSAERGEFYRLNPSAAFAWCALEEGSVWPDIALALAEWRGISPDAARSELADLAAHWLGVGILRRNGEEIAPVAPDPAKPSPPKMDLPPRFDPAYFAFRTHTYRLLGVNVRVRYGDPELEHRVHPVLAHLETATTETEVHTLTVARILGYLYVFSGNDYMHFGRSIPELAPQVKFAVLDHAIRRYDHILHLHAGAVASQGRLVILPAASGSGKTSLTARLVAAGCEYFSDEVVLLERGTGRVRPAPVSLCVKDSGADLLGRYFPGIAELPEHDRQDGLKVRYLPPPADSLPASDRTELPALLVFPRFVEGTPVTLRPLSRTEAFGRLLDDCVAIPKPLDLADAAVLMDVMEGLQCFELSGGDLDLAAESILALLR